MKLKDIKNIKNIISKPILKKIEENNKGLILVSGATGYGKSTLLLSLLFSLMKVKKNYLFLDCSKPSFFDSFYGQHYDNIFIRNPFTFDKIPQRDNLVFFFDEVRDDYTFRKVVFLLEQNHTVFVNLSTFNSSGINRILSFSSYLKREDNKNIIFNNGVIEIERSSSNFESVSVLEDSL